MVDTEFRKWGEGDDYAALTTLLHCAYRELAEQNLQFLATWQTEDTTRERVDTGETWVAVRGGRYVGTVTLYLPHQADGCEWYDRPEVASFGQFGVDPECRGEGIGRKLLEIIERRAKEEGAAELALDTAEPAVQLIATYARHGYRFIQHVQWTGPNYRSVVLSKTLTG